MLTAQAHAELEFERGREEGERIELEPKQRKEIAGHGGWVEEWTPLAGDAEARKRQVRSLCICAQAVWWLSR